MVGMSYRDPTTKQLVALPLGCAGGGSPVGAVIPYMGNTAPVGWVIADGRAHNSPALLSLIGSANTPDLRGKFILAASSTHAARTTGGEETHTLTEAEIPAHNHTGTTGNVKSNAAHTHSVFSGISESAPHNWDMAYSTAPVLSIQRSTYSTSESTNTDHQHDFTTANKGGGGAHNNMPPFYAMIYIIKAFAESASGGITQDDADARYVKKSGDTMTGKLNAPGIELLQGDANGAGYDGSIYVPASTGLVVRNAENIALAETVYCATPTDTGHAATKGYVDNGFIPLRGEFEMGVRSGIQQVTSDSSGFIVFPSIPDGYTIVSCFFGQGGNEIFCSFTVDNPRGAYVWHAGEPTGRWANATALFRWIAVKTS